MVLRPALEPVQKQIVLLKLVDLMENVPDFSGVGQFPVQSPQRRWLALAGALLKRVDKIAKGIKFDTSMRMLDHYKANALGHIFDQVNETIEELKLDLELEGRSDIGSVYGVGEVYKLFSDLKDIIGSASQEILVVDPYFNCEAFDDYLSTIGPGTTIKIMAQKYAKDVQAYAEKHTQQYGTNIEIRRSNELHDRLIIVDDADCWVIGGSIKDAAGKSPTYLLPLQPELSQLKRTMYSDIWSRGSKVT